MAKLSMCLGLALALVGIAAYVVAGFESATALIPTFLGTPIAVCGFLTRKHPDKAVIFMHIAVVLAVLLFGGSASRIPKLEEFGSIKSVSIWVTAILSFILIGAFAQSFLQARRTKKD